jgi:hypothetical protein
MQCILVLLAAAHVLGTAHAAFLAGINIDPMNPGGNPAPLTVNATGAQIVRVEFKDASPAGPIPNSTFAIYDPVVEGFIALGIDVLLILDYMTYQDAPWGQTDPSVWAPFIGELGARSAQIAGHYAALEAHVAYEIWNEEDLQQTLVPAAIYATLLQTLYQSIKSTSTSAVIFGGLASGNPGYVSDVAAAGGGVIYADGLGKSLTDHNVMSL